MKRGKKQKLLVYNGLMSGALALLGFAACDENGTGTMRCEYGTPYSKYEIKGKVRKEYGEYFYRNNITGYRNLLFFVRVFREHISLIP